MRTLLSWSLLCLLLLASTLPAQLAPGFDAESAEGGGKYPLNGIHPRSASQILRVETDPGDGSPLVQRLFKVVAEQDCEYITVARNESSWSATQAVPTDFVKIYSDSRIVVYINPECACDPHGQELELLSLNPAAAGDVRLRRVMQPEKPVYTQELYNGENLLDLPLGATSRMNLSQVPDSTEFSLQAEVCDPDCTDPDSSLVIQSFDSRAIVFLHGDNVEEKAVAKGLDLAQAQSRVIGGEVLTSYMDLNGTIDFGPEADAMLLIVYEQDGVDGNDSNWAWDDHMQLVDACGGLVIDTPALPVEVTLRDSITSDPAYTSWNGYISAGGNFAGERMAFAEATNNGSSALALKTLRVTIFSDFPNFNDPDWQNISFKVKVYDDFASAQADPHNGTHELIVAGSTLTPQPWGTVDYSPFGHRTTFLLEFDLTSLGVAIPVSSSKWVGFHSTGPTAEYTVAVAESDELGVDTDWSYGSILDQWLLTTDLNATMNDGRLGMSILAESF